MAVLQSNDYKKNLAIFRPTGASANRGYEPTESQLREVLEKQGAKAIGVSTLVLCKLNYPKILHK